MSSVEDGFDLTNKLSPFGGAGDGSATDLSKNLRNNLQDELLVDISDIQPAGDNKDLFCIDEDSREGTPSKSSEFQVVELTDENTNDNITTACDNNHNPVNNASHFSSAPTAPSRRRSSDGSGVSEVSSLFPIYEVPGVSFNLPQSDLESCSSEWEDGNSSLDRLSKDTVYQAYLRIRQRYHKYKGRYSDLLRVYQEKDRETDKLRDVLTKQQDKAVRRISELREQCNLEQQAKAHLEEELRNDLEEKDHKIEALQTKVRLLQEGCFGDASLKVSPSDGGLKPPTEEGGGSGAPSIQGEFDTVSVGSLGSLSTAPTSLESEDLIEKLKDDLTKHKTLLGRCMENIRGNKEKITHLTHERDAANQQLQEKINYIETLKAEHEIMLESLRSTVESSALSMAETKQQFFEELQTKEEEVERYRRSNAQLQKTVDRLEKEAQNEGEEEMEINLESQSLTSDDVSLKNLENLELKCTELENLIGDLQSSKMTVEIELKELKESSKNVDSTLTDSLNVEKKDLELRIGVFKEESRDLKKNLSVLEAEKTDLIASNKMLKDENDILKGKDNDDKNNSSEVKLIELSTRCDQLKIENSTLSCECERLRTENSNLSCELKSECERLGTEISILSCECERLKTENSNLSCELKNLNDENESLNSEVSGLNDENESLHNEFKLLKEQLNKFEEKEDQMEKDLLDVRNQLDCKEREKENMENAGKRYENDLEILKGDKRKLEERVEQLSKEMESIRVNEIGRLESEKVAFESNMTEKCLQMEKLEQELTGKISQLEELQMELNVKTLEMEKLQVDLTQKNTEMKELQQELISVKENVEVNIVSSENEIIALKNIVETKEVEEKKHKEQLQELENRLKDEIDNRERLKTELSTFEVILNPHLHENSLRDNLFKKLENIIAIKSDLEIKVEEFAKENESFRSRTKECEKLSHEIEDLRKRLEYLDQKNKETEDKLNKSLHDVDDLEKDLKNVKSDNESIDDLKTKISEQKLKIKADSDTILDLETSKAKLTNDYEFVYKEFEQFKENTNIEIESLSEKLKIAQLEKSNLTEQQLKDKENYEIQINCLNKEKENLISELNGKSRDFDEQRKRIESLTKELENLSMEKESFLNQVKSLLTEKETFTDQINALSKDNENISNQINSLLKEKDNMLNHNKSLSEEKEDLSNQIEYLLKEKNELLDQIDSLLKDKEDLSKDLRSSSIENGELSNQINSLLKEKDELSNHIGSLLKEKEDLSNQLKSLLKEKETLVNQIGIFSNEKFDLSNQINSLLKCNEELSVNNDKLFNEIGSLSKEKEDMANQLNSLLTAKEELSNQIIILLKEKEDLANEYNSLLTEKDSLSSQIKYLSTEKEDLSNKLKSFLTEKESLSKSLLIEKDELSNKLNSLLAEREDLANKIVLLIAEKEEISNSFSIEKKDLSNHINSLLVEKDDLLNQLKSLLTEKEDLTEKFNSVLAEKGALSDRLQSLLEEKESLSNHLQSLLAENVTTANQLKSMLDQKESLSKQLHSLSLEKDELNSLNEEKKRAYEDKTEILLIEREEKSIQLQKMIDECDTLKEQKHEFESLVNELKSKLVELENKHQENSQFLNEEYEQKLRYKSLSASYLINNRSLAFYNMMRVSCELEKLQAEFDRRLAEEAHESSAAREAEKSQSLLEEESLRRSIGRKDAQIAELMDEKDVLKILLEEKEEELRQVVFRWEDVCKKKENEMDSLREKLTATRRQMEEQVQEMESSNTDLRQKIDNLQVEMSNLEKLAKDGNSSEESLMEKRREIEEEKRALEEEKRIIEEEKRSMEEEMSQKILTLTQQVEEMKNGEKNYLDRISRIEDEKNNIVHQVTILTEKEQKYQSDIFRSSENEANYLIQIKQYSENDCRNTTCISQLKEDIKVISDKLSNYEKKECGYLQQISELNENLSSLQQRTENIRVDNEAIEMLEAKVKELTEKLGHEQLQNSTVKHEMDELVSQKEELIVELEKLKLEFVSQNKELVTELKKQKEEIVSQREELNSQKAVLVSQNEKLVTDLENQNTERLTVVESLNEQMKTLSANVTEHEAITITLNQALDSVKEQLNSKEKLSAHLSSQLKEKEDLIQMLTNAFQDLTDEVPADTDTRDIINRIKKERNNLKQQIENEVIQRKTMMSDLNVSKNKLEKLYFDLKEREEEKSKLIKELEIERLKVTDLTESSSRLISEQYQSTSSALDLSEREQAIENAIETCKNEMYTEYEEKLNTIRKHHEEERERWKNELLLKEKEMKTTIETLTLQSNNEKKELEKLTRVASNAFRSGTESVDLLKEQVLRQRMELEETKRNHRKELEEFQNLLDVKRRRARGDLGEIRNCGTLEDAAEFEYLRNILYQYMIGKETQTLSKVLCAVVKFNNEQQRQVVEHEDRKQNILKEKLRLEKEIRRLQKIP